MEYGHGCPHDYRTSACPVRRSQCELIEQFRAGRRRGHVPPLARANETDVRPFTWDETNGLQILTDLELISPNVSPFIGFGRFAAANAINDAGVIAGETWDETGALMGLHWDSPETVPTLRPCPEPQSPLPQGPCAIWFLNESGDTVGGEEGGGAIVDHIVWDGVDPFIVRDRLLGGPLECAMHSLANDGTLAGVCEGENVLLIPVGAGPSVVVTSPAPNDEILAGIVPVHGFASDDVGVVSVTVNGLAANLESTGNPADPNEVEFSIQLVLAPGLQTVEVVATDGDGNTATADLVVAVLERDGLPPTITDLIADPNPSRVEEQILLTAEIDDTGTGGSSIMEVYYTIDGGPAVAMFAEDGAFDEPTESVVAEIPGLADAGNYEVCITATDVAGNVSAPVCTFVVVFDPKGGYVIGRGWIDVPAGAYLPDPQLSGKANFRFVARYRKKASKPSGSTEFQFHNGDLNLHSTVYSWLVIRDGDDVAQLAGDGTLNGQLAPSGLPYRFMLWARDGSVDSLRLRIWWDSSNGEVTVFDNGELTDLRQGSVAIRQTGN